MTNMSYCRFQNTKLALQDCFGVIEEMVDCQNMSAEGREEEGLEAASELSRDEAHAALCLFEIAKNIAVMGDANEEVLEALRKKASWSTATYGRPLSD